MFNKYDQIKMRGLLRTIQDIAVKLDDVVYCKKTPLGKQARMYHDIDDMRSSFISRLKELGIPRTSPKFFPVDTYVHYKKKHELAAYDDFSVPVTPEKFGRVVAQEAEHLIVQFEDEDFQVRVLPTDLKLRFIKKHAN